MGSRRKARVIALQALYAWEMSASPLQELLEFRWMDADRRSRLDETTLSFARHLIAGAIENIDIIDGDISAQLEHWDIDRLRKVDLALLRMSVFALDFQEDIPPTVIIDEAVDIAKLYSIDDSYRFVNGVLDGIRKKKRKNGAKAL